MCAPENYREVSEHVGKHVDVCSHLLSFGILPLVAAGQGLSMLKLSFVTEVFNFYDPNCIQFGGNLNIPLKMNKIKITIFLPGGFECTKECTSHPRRTLPSKRRRAQTKKKIHILTGNCKTQNQGPQQQGLIWLNILGS